MKKMKPGKKSTVKFYIFLIITILLMGTIFFFSSQVSHASDEQSGYLVELLQKLMGKSLQGEAFDTVVFLVRKGAHFSEYLLLGLFFSLTVKEKRTFLGKEFALCTLGCALYAVTDEIHQQFVPGRSCEFRDICIDASGAALGCFLIWMISRAKRRK